MIDWQTADRKLREVAQLRSLFRRLPHVPTSAEKRLLEEFDEFLQARRPVCSRAAAVAGLASLWERQDLVGLVAAVRKMPPEARRDRDVRAYAVNARRLIGAIRKRHEFHRHAPTGLNDLLNAWDPIGVADLVSDEYASYAPEIVGLLASGADEKEIAKRLAWIVSDRIGLRPDAERERLHAAGIVAWHRKLGQARG